MKTQISDVKKFFETHPEGLTSKQAFDNFGATRLPAIVHTLRKKHGMNIVTYSEIVPNRYGGLSHVALYKLVD